MPMKMNCMKQRRQRRRELSAQLGCTQSSSSQRPSKTPGPLVRSKNDNCFCEEEEDLLIKLHTLLGNRWSLIAGRLPGRTAEEVESYWNRHMRSKLKCTGLDPGKHGTSTFPLLPDGQQTQHWRQHRPRNAYKVGRPDAKHPESPPSSNDAKVEEEDVADDGCVSDAGSAC